MFCFSLTRIRTHEATSLSVCALLYTTRSPRPRLNRYQLYYRSNHWITSEGFTCYYTYFILITTINICAAIFYLKICESEFLIFSRRDSNLWYWDIKTTSISLCSLLKTTLPPRLNLWFSFRWPSDTFPQISIVFLLLYCNPDVHD